MTDFWAGQRLLVVTPHADDEAYGCGGTIAKVKAAGGEVFVIVASVGDLRHCGSVGTVTGETRAAELKAAMEYLQVDGYEILFTDGESHLRLDTIPRRDLVALLERDAKYSIDKVRPTALILPAPSYNQDHGAIFDAGFTACRPHRREDKHFIDLVLTCDSVQLGWGQAAFHPDVYVDISEYLGAKLDALAFHKSQLRPAPDPGSLQNVERLARLRGADIGVDAAEAYECHRIAL
ncbi:MAG: PIG-L family deacetylase [Bacillati bacterium ANGP1]|uniref:PIG-L family deacetylase n=1 Tax=Candidatus Segetimicrobium genomatis TaxID=2569760 RepID=A0A537KCK8_9BACT|nr:MAG: PIG-L family deacetylase [Terrabacteria group bacterium ANGP1]